MLRSMKVLSVRFWNRLTKAAHGLDEPLVFSEQWYVPQTARAFLSETRERAIRVAQSKKTPQVAHDHSHGEKCNDECVQYNMKGEIE